MVFYMMLLMAKGIVKVRILEGLWIITVSLLMVILVLLLMTKIAVKVGISERLSFKATMSLLMVSGMVLLVTMIVVEMMILVGLNIPIFSLLNVT